MLVYVFASVISLIFAYLSQHSTKHIQLTASELVGFVKTERTLRNANNRITLRIGTGFRSECFFAFLSFLPLYIVSAIRYLVGTDYATTYKSIYLSVYSLGYHFQLTGENLYKLLNRIAIIYSGSDYVGVFPISSLLVCVFIFVALKKQSINFGFSILLWIISGFYFWSFNGVRQSIAISIFIFSIQYIYKRKPIKYFLLILISAGFHTTGFLYLPFYFINKFRINVKIMLAFAFVSSLFSESILRFAYFVTSRIPVFNVYAVRYLDSSKYDSDIGASISHFIINLAFWMLFVVIKEIYDKKRINSNIWINFQSIALAFSSLANVFPVANRLTRLFEIVLVLSIPCMTKLVTNKTLRLIINVSIIVCFCLYVSITFFVLGYHDILPYRTIFSR